MLRSRSVARRCASVLAFAAQALVLVTSASAQIEAGRKAGPARPVPRTKRWEKGTELFEYVCQGNNYAPQLMSGASGEQRGTSAIVP